LWISYRHARIVVIRTVVTATPTTTAGVTKIATKWKVIPVTSIRPSSILPILTIDTMDPSSPSIAISIVGLFTDCS